MLSQSNYWTRHVRDIAKTGEWFHKTTEQWAMETGLMLSHALHLTRLQSRRQLDHWVASPAARWFEELGRWRGTSTGVGLIQTTALPQSKYPRTAKQECGISTVKFCRNRQFSFALSAYTVLPIAPFFL
jgi:hypothetical protein